MTSESVPDNVLACRGQGRHGRHGLMGQAAAVVLAAAQAAGLRLA